MNNEAALQCLWIIQVCVCVCVDERGSKRVQVYPHTHTHTHRHTDAHRQAFFNSSSIVAEMLVLRRGLWGLVFLPPPPPYTHTRKPKGCPPLVNFFVSFLASCLLCYFAQLSMNNPPHQNLSQIPTQIPCTGNDSDTIKRTPPPQQALREKKDEKQRPHIWILFHYVKPAHIDILFSKKNRFRIWNSSLS